MSKVNKMKAFHGKIAIKRKYLSRIRAHVLADEIIKGIYWNEGKGCAVGCTIHSSNHNAYETELGIPEWLARVEDTLFEGMTNARAKKWPLQFLKAIQVGADLESIKVPFVVFILENSIKSMQSAVYDADKNPLVKAAIEQSITAVRKMIRCHEEGLDLSAAWSAAESVESAARSAAESAAWSVAESARSAAWSAAWSTRAAARSAARSAAYELYADELLKFLKNCKPKSKKKRNGK